MNIKKMREAKGITQQALADRLGVRQSAVAMWETNKSLPRTSTLPDLAKALDCTIDELLGNEKEGDRNVVGID